MNPSIINYKAQSDNNNFKSRGWERRDGIGITDNPPDVIDTIRKPVVQLFFKIDQPTNNYQIKPTLNNPIENVTTISISKAKIVLSGLLNPVPDIGVLRFKQNESYLFKTKTYHNLRNISDECFVLNLTGTKTTIEFNPPLLLMNSKTARNFSHLNAELVDLDNKDILFENIYLWLHAETMNWQ